MTATPKPAPRRTAGGEGRRLLAARLAERRLTLSPAAIARRRILVRWLKLLLPVLALGLLSSVVLWPELDKTREQGRISFRRMGAEVGGAQLLDARYRGVDKEGRPYTVTAAVAQQVDQDRVNLTDPKGDITLQNGTWLMIESKQGVFMQKENQLDLSKDVTLYRDDGTTLRTQSATIDIKAGAATGAQPVSAEGPFGTLDAQGFTVTDQGTVIQFAGPAKLVLSGTTPDAQPAAPAAATAARNLAPAAAPPAPAGTRR